MNKTHFSLGLLILALSAAGILYYLARPVITAEAGITYYLKPGTAKKTFIADLSNAGIIKLPFLFTCYTWLSPTTQLKVGEYYFAKGSSLVSIWRQVTNGKGFVQYAFTIVPGCSFKQLRDQLANSPYLKHLTTKLTDQEIMQYLGSAKLPEGQFFPETYYYARGVLDLVILKRSYDLMQIKLKEAWANRDPKVPYKNPYEGLIAASIVEKEAYLRTEQARIASVLVNRLKLGMLLQFDPTVIYGLGDRFDGKIRKTNLQDPNSYNTYMHKGLPPTPIAMPGLSAIHAALHPEKSNYLYFVAKGDGSHQFSNNLNQHQNAVLKIAARNADKQTILKQKMLMQYLHFIALSKLKIFIAENPIS